MLPHIHSHDSWTQLEEVWLGDVYPVSFYDHLQPEIKDVFYRLTEITQHDLAVIQQTLESMGVTVQRPIYESIHQYIDHNTGQLVKPDICPRDNHLVLGQTLFINDNPCYQQPWQHAVEKYQQHSDCKIKTNKNRWFCGANTVRLGRDIMVDYYYSATADHSMCLDDFLNYRVTFLNNGGHCDGCFAVLKPGLLMTSSYFDRYDETFPGWQKIHLYEPTYQQHTSRWPDGRPIHNGKFWEVGVPTNNAFNQHVIDYALDWVGTYTETYFELNCLVVNEQNVVMLGDNPALAQALDDHGITVHWVPFRARTFWDGGVHCLTLDIRRQGQSKDYFR